MLDYVSSKASMAVGSSVSGLLAVVAAVQSEWILIPAGIAVGVCAFLWGVRKYPIDELVNRANKALQENFTLKDRNTKLEEENEALRVRLAHLTEDSKSIRIKNPNPQKNES